MEIKESDQFLHSREKQENFNAVIDKEEQQRENEKKFMIESDKTSQNIMTKMNQITDYIFEFKGEFQQFKSTTIQDEQKRKQIMENFATRNDLLVTNRYIESLDAAIQNVGQMSQRLNQEQFNQGKIMQTEIEQLVKITYPVRDMQNLLNRLQLMVRSLTDHINTLDLKIRNIQEIDLMPLKETVDQNYKTLTEEIASLELRVSKSISLEVLDDKFSSVDRLINKALKDAAGVFVSLDCYTLDIKYLQQTTEEHVTKLQDHEVQIQWMSKELHKMPDKLDKKDILQFKTYVSSIPTNEQFDAANQQTLKVLNQFESQVKTCQNEVKAQNSIIARQDEILCEKAQKHEMLIMRHDLKKQLEEIEYIADKAQYQLSSATDTMNRIQQEQRYHIEKLKKMHEHQREILDMQQQIDNIQGFFDRINFKIGKKLSIDQFETQFLTKANKTELDIFQKKFDCQETQMKNVMVVLNESLRLHQSRPDEPSNIKENKLTILLSQMSALVNSISNGNKNLEQILTEQNMIDSHYEAPIDSQIHNLLPMSPRQKRSILSANGRTATVSYMINKKKSKKSPTNTDSELNIQVISPRLANLQSKRRSEINSYKESRF